MIFDELDKKMRIFETTYDLCVLPDMYMIARMDGRNFTKLTKEKYSFDVPFDTGFRDMMVDTVKHLMDCGFRVVYGYTESDEISLLLHIEDDSFGRKIRKLTSIFAGEASAKFSLLLGGVACFDARISQLPSKELVVDYFRWRNEDAHRNALNAYCYWTLRKTGKTANETTNYLSKMSVANKNELLFQHGIQFNEVPNWQKRGIGFYWETYEKLGVNPITGKEVSAIRNRLKVDFDLPMKEDYSAFLWKILGIEE